MAAVEVIWATMGGAEATRLAKARVAQQGALVWGPGQYEAFIKDHFVNQYKDFAVVTLDRSENPPRCKVTIGEDNEPFQVVPGPRQSTDRARRGQPHAEDIIVANYGGEDVTAIVRHMFQQHNGLSINEDPNHFFGDPLPGVYKALVVVYMTKKPNGVPHRAVAYWNFGEQVNLPRG